MTTFLLVRHAEHDFPPDRIAGLTPGVHLRGEVRSLAGSAAVYSSPLERCRETAVGFDQPVTVVEELNELDADPEWRRYNAFRSGISISGGESMIAVQARVVGLMLTLRDRHPNQTVALVTHADVIRLALTYWLGRPIDLLLRLEIELGSVSVVALDGYGLSVLGVNLGLGPI